MISVKKNVLKNKTEYLLHSDSGDAQLLVFELFSGIELSYNSVHMDSCRLDTESQGRVIEIRHCREGRAEQEFDDGFYYLTKGDLSIAVRDSETREYNFPLRHYHGITISIHIDKAPECFSCFLEDVNVQPMAVAERLCADKSYHILRNKQYIEHLFSEMYSVPEEYEIGYLKIKVMELLLILSRADTKSDVQSGRVLSSTQVSLAKKAAEHIRNFPDVNFSVDSLAREFHISETHLQNAFKGVYGVTVFSYLRIQKIHTAALKLLHSDAPVIEIAGEVGYDNPSKFASAFKEIMGESPLDYRRAHGIYHKI